VIVAKTGNEAMAYAMKQVNPDVVAAYPITPSTEIVQIFSSYVADGLVDTEYVAVESEHSAMSACIGAAAAGARAMTATASQGLALMHEMLFIAGGLRMPIVLCLASRSISSPLNIHCDHADSVASRDSGWIQIFSESSQEGYDSVIQAVRIAEKASMPVMVAIDGFILSHCMDRIEVLEDKQVQDFIGKYTPNYTLLDVDHPITVSPACLPDSYFEHKRAQAQAMYDVMPIIDEVAKDFGAKFGRHWQDRRCRCRDCLHGFRSRHDPGRGRRDAQTGREGRHVQAPHLPPDDRRDLQAEARKAQGRGRAGPGGNDQRLRHAADHRDPRIAL
jgi:pyruvate ferredoxin oxidoreductase alpha subunit